MYSTTKHILKVNNSYESEPSSGSASSQSDLNECPTIEDENINLPLLLKPSCSKDAKNESQLKSNIKISPTRTGNEKIYAAHRQGFQFTTPLHSSQDSPFKGFGSSPYRQYGFFSAQKNQHSSAELSEGTSTPSKFQSNQQQRRLLYGVPVRSSQESSFEGFSDSSIAKMQKRFNKNSNDIAIVPTAAKSSDLVPSPSKNGVYDTIITENSCNAMDMPLSEAENISEHCDDDESSDSSQDKSPSAELSFNGKIRSLTINPLVDVSNATAAASASKNASENIPRPLQIAKQLSDSFILKKYTNERSPDLFADTDEDDDDYETEAVQKNPLNVEKTKEHVTSSVFVEVQTKNLLNNILSKSQSQGCVADNSLLDDHSFDASTNPHSSRKAFYNNCQREKELLRRIRKCLDGVPPPPSLTIPQIDVCNAVVSRKNEIINYFSDFTKTENAVTVTKKSNLFKPTHTLSETKALMWKDILGVRQHGVCYNLNKASESHEYLSLAVVERFIGAETATSYQKSPSSAKKRNIRLKLLTQSPGSRLSHLAKRRAIFSSANLATTSQKSSSILGHQIMIDKNKTKHRRKGTPKRKTPGSRKKNRKTPSSSTRKRLFYVNQSKPGPSRETSKRALFQSPAKQQQKQSAPVRPPIKREIANRVEKSKRALFSPDKNSQSSLSNSLSQTSQCSAMITSSYQLESLLKRKRNIVDVEDEEAAMFAAQSSNIIQETGDNLTPRALKIKSQSFCIGAGSSSNVFNTIATDISFPSLSFGLSGSQLLGNGNSRSSGFKNKTHFQRAHSDMITTQSTSLTENQRKKLLWAVSQALQEKKITTKHDSFKQYASALARIVKRIFHDYYLKTSTSNSETMLRLAKKYAYHVISGKNVDEIYLHAKHRLDESKRQSSNRLTGYIGPEEYAKLKKTQPLPQSHTASRHHGSMVNIFGTENSTESFSLSQNQTIATYCTDTQSNLLRCMSHESSLKINSSATKQQPQIESNAALQNSSSKNNLSGLALRENVDCEQRRSAQKNFTGKDQRNVSPYAKLTFFDSTLKTHTQFVGESNSAKTVKRQIQFDL